MSSCAHMNIETQKRDAKVSIQWSSWSLSVLLDMNRKWRLTESPQLLLLVANHAASNNEED